MKKAVVISCALVLAVLALILAALLWLVPPYVEQLAVRNLAERGIGADVRFSLACAWHGGPCLDGDLAVCLSDSPARLDVRFEIAPGGWSVDAVMPKTDFSERDRAVCQILAAYPLAGVSNLAFSVSAALEAKAEWSWRKPVIVWRARLPIRDFSLRADVDGQPLVVEGLSVSPGVSGLSDHLDIAPMTVRVKSISAAGVSLTNGFATIRASERSLLVNEASFGFCGGSLNMYSLRLDPKSLSAGVTLFVENVEAAKVLECVQGFNGTATGLLHGKIKVYVREGGKAIRLRDAYLYSTPGQMGTVRMVETSQFSDVLTNTGLDADVRDNLTEAIKDLSYDVLRLDLVRQAGDDAVLTICLRGSAKRGELSVPVDLTVNIRGGLEQLINVGLGFNDKLNRSNQR